MMSLMLYCLLTLVLLSGPASATCLRLGPDPARPPVLCDVETYRQQAGTNGLPAYRPYRRSAFTHWISAGRAANGCPITVRERVLIEESREPVTWEQCRIIRGRWADAYTGEIVTDPRALDVDHVVSLEDAWESGAWAWTRAARTAYANDLADPDHLIAVSARENRRKGARGPDAWTPPNPWRPARCYYARVYHRIKREWLLTETPAEHAAEGRLCGVPGESP